MPLFAACMEESLPPLSALAMEEPLPPIAAAAMEEPPPPLSVAEEGVKHDDDEIVGYVEDAIGHDDAEIAMLVAIRDNGGSTGRLRGAPPGWSGAAGGSAAAPVGRSLLRRKEPDNTEATPAFSDEEK
jgi:hypothetical protein